MHARAHKSPLHSNPSSDKRQPVSDIPKLPTPKEFREIAKRLPPKQLEMLERQVSDVIAEPKRARYLNLLFQADAAAKNQTVQMTRYLARACPDCKGYVDVMMPKPRRDISLGAVKGKCVKCNYRMSWIIVSGGKKDSKLR